MFRVNAFRPFPFEAPFNFSKRKNTNGIFIFTVVNTFQPVYVNIALDPGFPIRCLIIFSRYLEERLETKREV